jgi:hypothetical protein
VDQLGDAIGKIASPLCAFFLPINVNSYRRIISDNDARENNDVSDVRTRLNGAHALSYAAGEVQGIPLKGPQRRDKSAEIPATMSRNGKRANEPYG